MTQEPTTPAPGSGHTGGGAAALQSANRLDLGIVGAGVLAFFFSMIPSYYTVSLKAFGVSSSGGVSAWHGFFGWFGALLALAAAVVLVLHLMGQALPVPVRTTVLGLMAASLVCAILALFIFPGGSVSGLGIDTGHGVGYWLTLLATIAGTVLAGMRRGEA